MTSTVSNGARRIGVIGGGIAGLAAAHFLRAAGYTPVVIEAGDRVGGLGADFEHEGVSLDRFYHVMLDSDADLRALIAEVGLADRVVWSETGMGFLVDGRLYGFNTPVDLLRFGALAPVDRLRTGLGALYLTRAPGDGRTLDEIPARAWLTRLFGPRVFARLWEPLLRAKFGDHADALPAYWVWYMLRREKNGSREVKGYLHGGFRALADRLRESIVAGGGEVLLDTPVHSIESTRDGVRVDAGGREMRFAAVVSTLPLPLLARVARDGLGAAVPQPTLAYQGVVVVLVVTRRPLERFYWTAVVDPAFAHQGVVETTHVIPPDWLGGRHLVYLMNYCAADSEPYRRSDATHERQALDGLSASYGSFDTADVEATYVFRAPHVEPAWTVGYLRNRPSPRVGASRVYLCTTAQAYPRVTAWNTSVGLARETVATLTGDLR
jgi:protoporphyrinogen oxidase